MPAKTFTRPVNDRLNEAIDFLSKRDDERPIQQRADRAKEFLRPAGVAKPPTKVTISLDEHEIAPLRRIADSRGVSIESILCDAARRYRS